MRMGLYRLKLLLLVLPGALLAACAPEDPPPPPGPPVAGEGFVLPSEPIAVGLPGTGEWQAFRCDGETTAFVSAPATDSVGTAVAFVLAPDTLRNRLPAQGEGAYGNGMTRVRFVEDALEVGTDTRPTARCTPDVQGADRLDDASGLRFITAVEEPAPGWRPVRQGRAPYPYWLGPGRMRVAPGELRRVAADHDPITGEDLLTLELRGDAVNRFAHLTGVWTGRPLAVVVDGRVLLAPTIVERIEGGRISLSGLSEEEMQQAETALQPLLDD